MNKLLTKIAGLSIGLAMAIGVGVAVGSKGIARVDAAQTDYSFQSSIPSTWTASMNNTTTEAGDRGVGWGAAKGTITLTLTNTLTVTNVTITASTNNTGNTLAVKVGSTNFGNAQSIASGTSNKNKQYSFDGSSSGNVVVTIADTAKTVWIKAISVTTSSASKKATTTAITATPSSISIGGNSTLSANVTYTGGSISSPSVTYTTEDTSIVSISGSTITGLAEGTATITGSYAGDSTYEASSGTTTVTVAGAVYEETFSLYSGDISEGDYVVCYNGNAIKNSVSSSRLTYASVSPTNDKIVNPSVSIVWHIAQSGDYWTLYNDAVEKYAGSTGSKNQAALLSEVTDNAKWTVTGSSTYDFENLGRSTGSDPNNKWLRYNAGYGFACYASGTGGALSLYKAPVSVTGVTVSPTSKSLVVGEHQQLTATVSPDNATDKSVTWKSYSDSTCTTESSAVASVSSTGYVTAVAEGTAYIQVKTTDGGFTAKCTITVTGASVPVTGVSVSPTAATITIGGTQQLTPTVSPADATNKSVTYSTNNSTVATVSSSGLITANAVGSATITVTTVDGGFTATCAVTVNPVSVTGVTVSPTNVSLAIGGTQQLTATVSPDNATDKSVTWKSYSDSACTTESSAVASVSSTGLVTAVAKGTAYIQVKTVDGNFTAVSTVSVLNLGTVTFVAATDEASGTSHTKNGITISTTNGSFSSTDYRIYKGATLTVSSTVGNIASIEMTFDNVSNNGGWSSDAYYSEDGINSNSWSKTTTSGSSGKQARITEMTVTFEQGETYTITYYANGGSDEMEPTVGTTPIVAANGFTPPEGKEFLKWNTSADGNGDDYHPGDAVEEDLTLYAIWTLPVGGDITLNKTSTVVTTTSVQRDAAKCGTGNAGGSTVLTVKKAGITKIKMYVAGWSGDSTEVSVSVSSGTISPTSIEPTSDAGISGSSSTYTLEEDETTYRFDFTLTNVPADATITLSSSAGKQRFVVWGPTNLFATSFANTFLTELSCDEDGNNQPSFNDDYSWATFNALYDNLDEEEQGILHDATPAEYTTPSTDEQKISAAMARYDYIVGKYYYGRHINTYNDFIDRKPSPIGSYRNILGIINNGSVTAVIIIVITSAVSAAAVGGYFLFRRRKEQ